MAKPVSETTIVRSILDALTMQGLWCWRVNSGMLSGAHKGKTRVIRMAPAGTPDVFVVLPGGQLAGLEAKTPKGKQTPKQKLWQAKAERHGVRYAVVHSAAEALARIQEWTRAPRGELNNQGTK